MPNFFAALDDSDNEGAPTAPAITKKKTKKEVVEPSKVENRPKKDDRNTKGGRGRPAPTRDGKRQYDRRSGTGRGREIKKSGGGGRNWGSDKNAAKKAEGPVVEGAEDVNTPEGGGATEEEVVEEEEKVKEPEPVDNTMSYEEYMATKAKPDSAHFKPVETREVENEFAGKTAAKKEGAEDFLVMGGGKQLKKKGTKKAAKETLVLDFKVKNAISDDRRREGRRDGGGRRSDGRRDGGGGRQRGARGGGGRGGKVDTNDANAFPSL